MKTTKYLSNILLGLMAVASFMSCSEQQAEYTPAPAQKGAQVYFTAKESYDFEVTETNNTFEVTLNRVDSTEAADITLSIVADEETTSLISIPTTAKFEANNSSCVLTCIANVTEMEFDKVYNVAVSIADSSNTTPSGISMVELSVVHPAPWTSLGMATVVDDIMTAGWGVPYEPFKVEIQENDLTPGLYRLVNPYTSSYPWNEPGDFDDSKDYYLEIHAEDPDAVWFGRTELGLDWGYGMISAWTIADYYVQNGNDPEVVKAKGFYGTLKDGEITFPVDGILFNMPQHPNGNNWYYANGDGMFSILLPGYVKADYSAEVQYAGIYTAADESVYAVANLTLGADATDVKAIVMPQEADAAAVADAIAAGELEAVEVAAGRIEIPFDAEELATDKFQIIAVVLADSAVKTIATSTFEYYGGGANPWKSIGVGYFTDDIIAPLVKVAPPTYEVEIYENEKAPGLYRVMNPYSNSVYPLAEDDAAPEGLYLEVNAMDANAVYVQYQTLGFDWGVGEFGFATVAADLLLTQGIPIETIKEKGYGGTLADGVIKFPLLSNSSGAKFQGYVYGAGELFNYAGMNGKFEITLPSANAFAKNMAKARTKVSSLEVQKGSLSAVNVEKVFSKTLLRKPIAIDIQK